MPPIRVGAPEDRDHAWRAVAHPGYRPPERALRSPQPARPHRTDDRPAHMPRNGAGVAGRRTVTITGRGAERVAPSRVAPRRVDRGRRPPARRHERAGFQPDRAAMWAVALGVLLILAALASAHP